MVAVRAVTYNLISTISYALWGTTTPLSEKASNVYECGLACDSFANCGGFSWDEGMCQLVARVAESEDRPLKTNLYRLATLRGRRIVDRHTHGQALNYASYKQNCVDWGMMMLPPPVNFREKMTISIRRQNYMPIGGEIVADIFTDDFGNTFHKNDPIITWGMSTHPMAGREVAVLYNGYRWLSGNRNSGSTLYPVICMEHID